MGAPNFRVALFVVLRLLVRVLRVGPRGRRFGGARLVGLVERSGLQQAGARCGPRRDADQIGLCGSRRHAVGDPTRLACSTLTITLSTLAGSLYCLRVGVQCTVLYCTRTVQCNATYREQCRRRCWSWWARGPLK